MNIFRASAVAACAALGLLTVVPLNSQSRPSGRERTGEAGVPIVLGLPPAVAPERPDTTGVAMALPSVWVEDAATGMAYRRDYVLVQFRESASPSLRATALASAGASGTPERLWDGWERAAIDMEATVESVRAMLARDPAVAAATLDYRADAFATRPNDEFFSRQWNFEALDLPRAWDISDGASDQIIVAIVDSGLNVQGGVFTFGGTLVGTVSLTFAEAADLIRPGGIVGAFDLVYGDDVPLDLTGHGTHVAGTIAQLTGNGTGLAGIAHKVRLMPLKVLSGQMDAILRPGNIGGAYSTIAAGIRRAADGGAHVINLSLGGSAPAPILRDAITYAVSRGAFVAIAAGNDGDSGNRIEYPAAYGAEIEGAITVGAVGRDLRRASYSGFKSYLEICAPGGDDTRDEADSNDGISQMTYRSANSWSRFSALEIFVNLTRGQRPRYDTFMVTAFEGTSMATPHVSGVAALIYSQGVRNPSAVERLIKRFARPIDATADECGAGLVDPRGTLRGTGLIR